MGAGYGIPGAQADGNDGPYTDEGRFMAGEDQEPIKLGANDGDIVWRFDMIRQLPCWPQDAASSSPLVLGDFVYVGTGNGVDKNNIRVPLPATPSLIVLDKRTGKLIAKDQAHIGPRVYHGQWSSPSLGVVNGRPLVFYGAGDGFCPRPRRGRDPLPRRVLVPGAPGVTGGHMNE